MKISLLTDAPKHNLALMQLSSWLKNLENEVLLNMPIIPADFTYASVLFEKNKTKFRADEYGGPAYVNSVECGSRSNGNELPERIRQEIPDYSLYNLNYSLGYTFRPCFRSCGFCKVPNMHCPDSNHHSIWDFHVSKNKKICLLNNNTFFDKQWKETFEEIWDANLTVIDENGYDLRLIDYEKADALKRTKFQGKIHYAWDRIKDETRILEGLRMAPKGTVYVLIGYKTTQDEDIYRCQKIVDHGHDPYIMPFNQSTEEKRFKRFIDTFMWRKYKTIEAAWRDYRN
jgi:hypothetical protein